MMVIRLHGDGNATSIFCLTEKNSVCKDFYSSILAISHWMVYDVHGKKDVVTGVTKRDGRGKHNKHNPLVSEVNRQSEIDHINLFPVGDSHYCRAKSNKKYVEAGLIYNLTAQTSKKTRLVCYLD